MPFPKTDVTNILEKEGILKKNLLKTNKIGSIFSGYTGLGNKYLSAKDIRNLRNQAQKKLMASRFFRPFIKPSTIFKKVNNFEDFLYLIKILKNYFTMFLTNIKFGELKTHRIQQALKYQIVKNKN